MANNVPITPGVGATIATDDAGGAQYQLVKLVDGTEDSTTRITGGASGLLVNTELPAAAALADGASNPMTPLVGAPALLFNGTTWDRMRNNVESTLLASAARTATATTAIITNHNARGIMLFLRVTAAGTGNLSVLMRTREPGGPSNVILNGSHDPITTTTGSSAKVFLIYPGAVLAGAHADVVQAISLPMPRSLQMVVVHSDGSSWTYSLTSSLII